MLSHGTNESTQGLFLSSTFPVRYDGLGLYYLTTVCSLLFIFTVACSGPKVGAAMKFASCSTFLLDVLTFLAEPVLTIFGYYAFLGVF